MNEDKFQEILDDLWKQLDVYDERFGDKFEICFLVSRAAQEYRSPTIFNSYVIRDPFDCHTYLLGRKVIFTDQEFIPNFTGCYGLIEPVICCKDAYIFPTDAEPGDYILYMGHLKQVIGVTLEDGDRTLNIRDVPGVLSDSVYAFANASDKLFDKWVRYKSRRELEHDSWMNGVDNTEINDYLSSLPIT